MIFVSFVAKKPIEKNPDVINFHKESGLDR
jgi:hypothetical protein